MFFNIIIFLLGLVIGSFLNCVIYRLETGRSFLKGRSFCPGCKHILVWYDLVPLVSFLALGGKCRYCQKKINFQYPLVELATGILFFIIWRIDGYPISIIFDWALTCFLIIIFVYDLKHYLIPDKVVYPAIGLTLIYDFWKSDFLLSMFGKSDFPIAAFGAAGFFLLIVLVSKGRWMGAGDIKLAFLMGLILGWPNILVALFFAFFSGAIIGIGLILARKRSFKSEVPFGPFLVAGTLLAMFYGETLVNWYLSLYV